MRKLDDELGRLRDANTSKDDDLTTAWQNLRAELRAKQNAREQLTDSVRKLRENIKRAQDELDGFKLSNADIETAERERDGLSSKVTAAQKEFEEAKYEEQIRKRIRTSARRMICGKNAPTRSIC